MPSLHDVPPVLLAVSSLVQSVPAAPPTVLRALHDEPRPLTLGLRAVETVT